MSQDEHNAIVRTAKQYGKWTMTNASTLGAYRTAILSGTYIIQHTPADAVLSDEDVQQIVAGKHHMTPTVNIYQYSKAAKVS
jgi:hypothetical protein